MGGVVHLGNLRNLESLTLGMSVVRDMQAKPPWEKISREQVEAMVWALIRGDAKDDADAEQRARATALRSEAMDLLSEAEKLVQRARALLDEAASLSK